MRTIRLSIFAATLAAGLAAAVSTLVAQGPAPRPEPRPEPNRRFMMLDGRGSQLGVLVEDVDAGTADKAAGVRIADVDRDSAAEKAGLREGDLIVEFDGERVRSARQFTRLVQETASGRQVALTVVRDGQRQTLSVTPAAGTPAWSVDVDGDRIRRDVERSLRDLPRFDEFRFQGPAFDFGALPRMTGPRGRLGVQVDEMPPQLAEYFGAASGGVLVTGVTEGSAAAKGGLKAGDVITTVNGTRVTDYGALTSELQRASGDVSLGIVRDRKELTLKTTLEPNERRPATRSRRPA